MRPAFALLVTASAASCRGVDLGESLITAVGCAHEIASLTPQEKRQVAEQIRRAAPRDEAEARQLLSDREARRRITDQLNVTVARPVIFDWYSDMWTSPAW